MSPVVERSAEWIYRGVWRSVVECFRVPDGPPRLSFQQRQGELRVFHPSRNYLRYLKFYFWIGLVVIDVGILIGWLLILQASYFWGSLTAVPALVIAVVPDVIAYIAIHLRYDTIWYGVSERGLFIRRGIWLISEHTITIENIQNLSVTQGPVEQVFGIATVVVETAGAEAGEGADAFLVGNKSIMVGLDRADEVKELIFQQIRACRSTGLGDDPREIRPAVSASQQKTSGWTEQDRQLLQEILAEVKRQPIPDAG